MSDQTSITPPPITTSNVKPKRKWGWLKTSLAVIATVVFAFKILNSLAVSASPIQLEVRRTGAYTDAAGNVLKVLNVGSKPITITNVTINERQECRQNQKFKSVTLKVGDEQFFAGSCYIVRATIETTDGSESYSFSSDN